MVRNGPAKKIARAGGRCSVAWNSMTIFSRAADEASFGAIVLRFQWDGRAIRITGTAAGTAHGTAVDQRAHATDQRRDQQGISDVVIQQ
jgi:hypothetical protein